MTAGNKTEKFITASYALFVVASIIFLFAIFILKGSLGIYLYNTLDFALLGIPIFTILKILYKKKYKEIIKKDYQNIFTRRLKYVGMIIFFSAIIIFITYANILNKNLETNYSETYKTPITTIYLIINDLSRIIWPIVFMLFAINYFRNKDINDRYQNLKNLAWTCLFFGLLIPFCKTIGLIIYDLELVFLISLSNVLSHGL